MKSCHSVILGSATGLWCAERGSEWWACGALPPTHPHWRGPWRWSLLEKCCEGMVNPLGGSCCWTSPWGCVASSPWHSFGNGSWHSSACSSQCRAPLRRWHVFVSAPQRNLCFGFLFVVFSPPSPAQPGCLSSSCSVTLSSHQTLEAQIREQQWQIPWSRQARSQIYCSYQKAPQSDLTGF